MALNVLVVDDSDVIRTMIARTLRLTDVPLGDVFEAPNGREALQVMSDSWIDLVLADINMPVMDGFEMVQRMRDAAETRDVPVIVVSTEAATDRMRDLAANWGVSAWIRKPFTPEEIRDVVVEVTSAIPPVLGHDAAIDDAFERVLEQFAFVFAEPVQVAELPHVVGELMVARVSFSGASSGALAVVAPVDLCVEMAANVLGVDAEDETAAIRGADALGEVANMTVGHLATEIAPGAPTKLHPPVVERLERVEWDRLASGGATRAYIVEGRPVILSLGLRLGASESSEVEPDRGA